MKPVVAQRASYFEKKHSWKEETVKQKGNLTVFSPLQKAGSQSPLEPTNGHQMSQKTSPNAQLSRPPPQLSLLRACRMIQGLRALNNVHPNLNTYKST